MQSETNAFKDDIPSNGFRPPSNPRCNHQNSTDWNGMDTGCSFSQDEACSRQSSYSERIPFYGSCTRGVVPRKKSVYQARSSTCFQRRTYTISDQTETTAIRWRVSGRKEQKKRSGKLFLLLCACTYFIESNIATTGYESNWKHEPWCRGCARL